MTDPASSPISRDIGQVFIPVRDMEAAASWYAQLLGLDHTSGNLGPADTVVDIAMESGPRLCLDANHSFVASGPARFFFWTADMEATVEHLEQMDVAQLSAVEDIGSLSFVTFADIDGNLLMVAQPSTGQ